jgi:hypothetical protein
MANERSPLNDDHKESVLEYQKTFNYKSVSIDLMMIIKNQFWNIKRLLIITLSLLTNDR